LVSVVLGISCVRLIGTVPAGPGRARSRGNDGQRIPVFTVCYFGNP